MFIHIINYIIFPIIYPIHGSSPSLGWQVHGMPFDLPVSDSGSQTFQRFHSEAGGWRL